MEIRGNVAYDNLSDGGGYLFCPECKCTFYRPSILQHNSDCKNDNEKHSVFIKVFTTRELNKLKQDHIPFFASDKAIDEFMEKFKELF